MYQQHETVLEISLMQLLAASAKGYLEGLWMVNNYYKSYETIECLVKCGFLWCYCYKISLN